MEVKEAIEYLSEILIGYHFPKLDEVISLLQQGEIDKEELKKYRQMWEEFCVNEGDLVKVINCIKHRYEQKYLKEAKNDGQHGN